jgi:inosose dehydratase
MANIKWSYMDHWSMPTPGGPIDPHTSRRYMDLFVKQISAVGFTGYDTFLWRIPLFERIFGSVRDFNEFLRDRGIEKVIGVFWGSFAPYRRETHDASIKFLEQALKAAAPLQAELLINNPTGAYFLMEPVTDEKIKITAEFWNRAGKLTAEHGLKVSCHHEFWCGLNTYETIDKFYKWTDPKYVYYYCDAGQHAIAGVDPVAVYLKYHDRCSGFHFKDTHTVDTKGERFLPPDPECIAPSEARWFWEMGTPEGKVDFPALMRAIKEYNYKGWLGVEHDKADVAGGDYASSTCIASWYIQNVLSKIYA